MRPLHKFVSLKPDADHRIAKLIHNMFSKVVLVSSYSLAMEVARDFGLTCLTPDLQIVYAGAFLTKVGHFNRSQLDRAALYRRAAAIEAQVAEKAAAGIHFERLREQTTDKELDSLRRL